MAGTNDAGLRAVMSLSTETRLGSSRLPTEPMKLWRESPTFHPQKSAGQCRGEPTGDAGSVTECRN